MDKDNRAILNEAFFKKNSWSSRFAKNAPVYTPVGTENKGQNTNTGLNSFTGSSYVVSDTDEMKKRLVSSFGAIVGNNTLKTISSKAIKTFPIIISDNVDPETAINLKRLMEEQYADYVNLLVSNQVVDISEFITNNEGGNIAIQALEKISGADFSKRQGFATKTANGELSLNDIAKNDYLYNLVRQESIDANTGDPGMDQLLEDAIIIPSEKEDLIEDIQRLFIDTSTEILREEENNNNNKNNKNKDQFSKLTKSSKSTEPELYSQIFNNTDMFTKVMDLSVKDVLDKNPAIYDKFIKASFLLESRKITGLEYISYLTTRLGLPLSNDQKTKILLKNPKNTVDVSNDYLLYTRGNFENFDSKHSGQFAKTMLAGFSKQKIKDIAVASAGGLAAGAATTGVLHVAKYGINVSLPSTGNILNKLIALAGTSVGSAAIAGTTGLLTGAGIYLVKKIKEKKDQKVDLGLKYGGKFSGVKEESWKRVEYLIELMELQQKDLASAEKIAGNNNKNEIALLPDQLDKAIDDYKESVVGKKNATSGFVLESNSPVNQIYPYFTYTNSEITEFTDIVNEAIEEMYSNNSVCAELMEADISTTFPIEVKAKYKYDPKAEPEFSVVPSYATSSNYAYGSVEYDRRDIKDRRYNEPLMLKIKFRQRYSDDKFEDSELTAVIGILGVVTRVPSEEMKYVLKANSDGRIEKGIFQAMDNKDGIMSLISKFSKKSRDASKLPQSSEVWDNLEKISKLAVMNKLSGKQNNNISNAHLVFSIKELDELKQEEGIDYLKDRQLTAALMKRYSAFTIMVANDISERLYIFDDLDAVSWNVVPYSILKTGSTNDQLTAALTKIRDFR